MDDTLSEIVARLEALERRLDRLAPVAPRDPAEGECFFRREERRIVDLIVQLTVDRLEERMRERGGPPPPPGPPPPEPPHRGPRRSR